MPLPAAARPAVLAAPLLFACAAVPPPDEGGAAWAGRRASLQALDSWQLRGRVNVRYEDESHTPRIRWRQDRERYTIRLWGAFNAGAARIEGRPGRVTLEQAGETLSAGSPEALILDRLGYELPVSRLQYWVRGLPAPDAAADLDFNELDQLAGLRQDGWTVRYDDPRRYGTVVLPRRVEVTRPRGDVRLRFVGLNWTVGDGR